MKRQQKPRRDPDDWPMGLWVGAFAVLGVTMVSVVGVVLWAIVTVVNAWVN